MHSRLRHVPRPSHAAIHIAGLFAVADTRNINHRVYPKAILKREVNRFEKERIKSRTALGELDHPNYASRYFRSLNLPNITHQVL